MVEPVIETPWNTEMSPDEMRDYYEQKRNSLERECGREGCDATVEFPREYCSNTCEDYQMRLAMHELFDLPKPVKPEMVPRRTPEDMQLRIDELIELASR